jgi:hypothetical protein
VSCGTRVSTKLFEIFDDRAVTFSGLAFHPVCLISLSYVVDPTTPYDLHRTV